MLVLVVAADTVVTVVGAVIGLAGIAEDDESDEPRAGGGKDVIHELMVNEHVIMVLVLSLPLILLPTRPNEKGIAVIMMVMGVKSMVIGMS
jgi:hypothetical protein